MRQALTVAAVLATTTLAVAAPPAPQEVNPAPAHVQEAPPAPARFPQVPAAGHSLGSVTGGNFKMANVVIQKKCVSCHSDKVIKDAIAAGKNMQQIQERMEQKGVQLSADDSRVLGIFWKNTPLKKQRPPG